MSQNQTPEADKEDGIQETFLSHLFELRDRLIKAVGALLLVFLCLVYWAPDIFHLFSKPLLDASPLGNASSKGFENKWKISGAQYTKDKNTNNKAPTALIKRSRSSNK